MFRFFGLLWLLCNGFFPAQQQLPMDSLRMSDPTDIFIDDYTNVYVYSLGDFTFSKFDSLGTRQAQIKLNAPVKIQEVQNHLRIVLFSENRQEISFLDKNLAPIDNSFSFSGRFSFVKAVYTEDHEYGWLLEESEKRLIYYNFREAKTGLSIRFDFDTQDLVDFIVYRDKAYILKKDELLIFDWGRKSLQRIKVANGRRLRRENTWIYIFTPTEVFQLDNNLLKIRFVESNAEIVDKNHNHYLALIGNKFYLYPAEN